MDYLFYQLIKLCFAPIWIIPWAVSQARRKRRPKVKVIVKNRRTW